MDDLFYASFDSKTIWPPADKMPQGFDWEQILELGENPGLGIRKLHARGVTGRGVGIAIIDQPLLTEHQEYKNRLKLYEVNNVKPGKSTMHGAAAASIAVGKTVGVAPEANLYYIETYAGDFGENGFTYNFRYKAQGVRRILEINEQLPEDYKIRVISISVGWSPVQAGYDEITAAVEEAKAAGMLVVCSSIERVHGVKFHGLGRFPWLTPMSLSLTSRAYSGPRDSTLANSFLTACWYLWTH
ncbi:TPA: hypothetical protein EYP66_03975 [Candidatus Poribacteria bacterium]|nr:hypothetical protein [Candidatus Poribacteria bacterium]